MNYDTELRFLCDMLDKCNVPVSFHEVSDPIESLLDNAFDPLPQAADTERLSLAHIFDAVHPHTIYKYRDKLKLNYIFLLLPARSIQPILVIGPYLSEEVTHEQILEWAENFGMDAVQAGHLKNYYSNLPTVLDSNFIFAAISTFAETIWGKNCKYTYTDINKSIFDTESLFFSKNRPTDTQEMLTNMKVMERRYAAENDLMEAVAGGQNHKVELMFSGFSRLTMEQRITDPVRNLKNYCIIMNTLMRKSAEKGGVHPVYLDSTSSKFAHAIERMTVLTEVEQLMPEMYNTYCNLVKRHSLKKYSPTVQKAILCIDSDLTADLTLSSLADIQQISSGYLSTLFKKETGQTITEFIMQRRMKLAARLLETTKLQVQTVAQHCGIFDVHYFSKVFKKHFGVTPKEYRETKQQHS